MRTQDRNNIILERTMTFGALGGCSKQQPRTDDGMEEEEVAGETTRLVVPIVTATSTSSAATAANKTEPTSRTSSTPAEDDAANNPQRRQSIVEPRDILGLGIDILIFVSVQFVLRTQCKYCMALPNTHTSSLWCVNASASGYCSWRINTVLLKVLMVIVLLFVCIP